MMGKILVVVTGGTIGSQILAGEIQVNKTAAGNALTLYEEKHPGKEQFDVIEPFFILSENCRPQIWAELVNYLNQVDFSGYDGIIVTHGTDTLPYTAALLGYYFGGLEIPMLLVSSNYALGEPGSNGFANFEAAVDFIREDKYAGVFVIYKNEGVPQVFLPTRLMEAEAYGDTFPAYGGCSLGKVENGRFYYEERKENPPLEHFLKSGKERRASWTKEKLTFQNKVLKIQPYPGLDYEMICLKEEIKAVFQGAYHSGTLCIEGEAQDARTFYKRCRKRGIIFYFGPVKKSKNQYTTVRRMLEEGALPLYHCSEIAAYVKLQIACNQKAMSIEDFMKQNLYFERIE